MLKKIQKKVEDLRVKVYAGQNNEDTEKCLYDIEQMIFKAMDEALKISSKTVLTNSKFRHCPKCNSTNVIMFNSDNDLCNDCGVYFC